MPKAILLRLRDGTYRLERWDDQGRRTTDDYSSLVAALGADPAFRDSWRAVSAEDRRSGVLTVEALYIVPDE